MQQNYVNVEDMATEQVPVIQRVTSDSVSKRQFVLRGEFTFNDAIEDYSTVYLPSYRKPLPLLIKIMIYGICILISIGLLGGLSLFLSHLYHLSSAFAYIDIFSIVAIVLSTCFAQITRSIYHERRKEKAFSFHQPCSSSSLIGKWIEYSIYLLGFVVSIYLLVTSIITLRETFSSFVLSFTLGFLYMVLLKPGMAKWIIWMTVSPWHRTTSMKHAQLYVQYHPLVSVIVPAWNEEVGILSTMRSILASKYSPLELIVINDGSTDSSDRRIRRFLSEHTLDFPGKTIVYHYQLNTGKSGALNTGINLARGKIIVTTDADCIMAPDCITHLVQAFTNPDVMGCTGDYRVGNIHSLLGRVQAIEYAIGFYTRKADSLFRTVFVMSGTVSAFRASVFDRIGNFHVNNITEDLEITMRMHKAGMTIISEPNAIVYTESPVTVKGLFRQRLRWVRGTLDAFGEHTDLLFSRKREHGKIHAWIVLPLIRLNHFAVLFQVLCKYGILAYCLITHQYVTLAFTIWLISVIVSISILSSKDYRETALLSPIAWILLEIPNTIYAVAFIVGWWNYLHKKHQSWQRWTRQGIGQ